jgi:hypothetical protein
MILISPDPVSHAANVRYNAGAMLIFSGVPQELMVSLMVTKKEILRSLFVGMWLTLHLRFIISNNRF